MARFLTEADYSLQIKNEIRRLLDGSTATEETPYKLLMAEDAAISQIKKWLSSRYDCAAIFSAEDEARDRYIVMATVDIALYHLYSQTGSKDVPTHRKERYNEVLNWLEAAGKGEVSTDLPSLITEEKPGSVRLFSKPPENYQW